MTAPEPQPEPDGADLGLSPDEMEAAWDDHDPWGAEYDVEPEAGL
jgi:hypothetical protein